MEDAEFFRIPLQSSQLERLPPTVAMTSYHGYGSYGGARPRKLQQLLARHERSCPLATAESIPPTCLFRRLLGSK